MVTQNSSARNDPLQEQSGFKKSLEDGQSSVKKYPSLCNACQSVWKQPLEQLDPTLILGGQEYDLWRFRGPRRTAQDIHTSVHARCPMCSLYWENIDRVEHLDGSRMKDDPEHEVQYYLGTWNGTRRCYDLKHSVSRAGRNKRVRTFCLSTSSPNAGKEDISMISETTAGEDSWNFILGKFRTCSTTHKTCTTHAEGGNWHPTRLIDISSSEHIHLVDSIPVHHEHASYVTLSHRWSEHTPKLTSGNYKSWLKNIPFDGLTQTFRDTINIARRLGSQYLWIDSLCIIQDSKEDWEKESSSMGKVYQKCICNISATAASDGSESLFVEKDLYSIPRCMIEIDWCGYRTLYSFARSDIWDRGVIDSSLNKRGWVIQERLLSPRTISFGTQIFWECRELEACETWPDGLPANLSSKGEWSDVWFSNVLGSKSWLQTITKPTPSSDDPYRTWKTIVRSYTNSGLTKEEDRLVALSGVAQQIQMHLQDQYVAGLWRRDIFTQLIWYSAQLGEVRRPNHYRAPSWSWASIEGGVTFPWISRPGPELCVMLEARVYPKTSNSAGQLDGGYLRISALVCQIPDEYIPVTASSRVSAGINTHICWDIWPSDHGKSEIHPDLGPIYAVPIIVIDNCHYRGRRVLIGLVIQRAGVVAAQFRRLGLLTLSIREMLPYEEDKIDIRLRRNLGADSDHFYNDAEFEMGGIRWEHNAWVRRNGEQCGQYGTITLI